MHVYIKHTFLEKLIRIKNLDGVSDSKMLNKFLFFEAGERYLTLEKKKKKTG